MRKFFLVFLFILLASCGAEKSETEVRALGDRLHTVDTNFIQSNFFWPEGLAKAVTFSYDDGTVSDRKLVELFNTYGLKGSFNLNSGKFGKVETWDRVYSYIDSNEVSTLYEGHEVCSHSVNHPNLKNQTASYIIAEVGPDREVLESLTGYEITGFAYPFGTYDNMLFDTLTELRILYARRGGENHKFNLPTKFLMWKLTAHHSSATNDLNEFLLLPKDSMSLFSVWGHSWELEDDEENNNWEYMEGFLSEIGGREDIYSATLGEIYRYVTACEEVVFGEDGLVSNASGRTVWLNHDGEAVRIDAGEVFQK